MILRARLSTLPSLLGIAAPCTPMARISTIRTAHAFGSQLTLARLYDKHILDARGAEMKSAIMNGFGVGSFFFIIYAAYGLAFH